MAGGAARRRCGTPALLGLFSFVAGAGASWVPRRFSDYEAGAAEPDAAPGARRFRHSEQHQFEDGSELALDWEVDTDPKSLLELDLEHQEGARVLDCQPNQLVLQLPRHLASKSANWKHVTASDSLHGCTHLQGNDLYHRVLKVQELPDQAVAEHAIVRIATEELASAAHVFTHCKFRFKVLPAAAREPRALPQSEVRPRSSNKLRPGRRLDAQLGKHTKAKWDEGHPEIKSSFSPTFKQHQSMLNLDVPNQTSKLAWNWDYNANTTHNPQFKYTFPGGEGWVRLYEPYLKADIGVHINFTSKMKGMSTPPHVEAVGEFTGFADVNFDIATAINFQKERSAGTLDDLMKSIIIPALNATGQPTEVKPIKFHLGGTPLTIKPGFGCKLKAYHIGLLRGSLRVGLKTKLYMHGLMSFDTKMGAQANFSARAVHLEFRPPTWMLFTDHFELGVMLEPELSLKGGFGDMKDMQLGFALRPYFNISVMHPEAGALGDDEVPYQAPLAIYPYAAINLTKGKNYAVRVTANSVSKQTSVKANFGIVEFNDNVESFMFGRVSQRDLLAASIRVSILEDGKDPPVATGVAGCSAVVNGICKPSPVTASMIVDGKQVLIYLSIVFQENALNVLMTKMKSINLRFPSMTVIQDLAEQLQGPNAAAAELRMTRHSRSYNVPMVPKPNSSSMMLNSRVLYDLGPEFEDSWKHNAALSGEDAKVQSPKLDLLIQGKVVGTGVMPPVPWDQSTTLSDFGGLSGSLRNQAASIKVMVPLYKPGNLPATVAPKMVGDAEVQIGVAPPNSGAFWVYPYQAENFVVGQTYDFYWTLTKTAEGTSMNFTLTAMEVDGSGNLLPTDWQRPDVKETCSIGGSNPDIMRYVGGRTPCLFKYTMQIPAELADKKVAFVASWLGSAPTAPHWMVSTPVQFVSGRRLKASPAKDSMAAHCQAQPMKFKIGAGINLVERMKNVLIPLGDPGMGGMSSANDWTSQPINVWRLDDTQEGTNGRVQDHLPKLLCSGGICEAMLPGCNKTKSPPVGIKQIRFKLSRLFRWKKKIGPKLRHVIAYGLALLPSVIEVGQKEAQRNHLIGGHSLLGGETGTEVARKLHRVSNKQGVEGSSNAFENAQPQAGRRLKDNSHVGQWIIETEDDEPEETDEEFDYFTVRLKEQPQYDLSQALLHTLLHWGAFRGIQDGRESTHGPIEVLSADLEFAEPEPTTPTAHEELFDVAAFGAVAASSMPTSAAQSWTSTMVFGMATGSVAVLGIAVARLGLPRRGLYTHNTASCPPDYAPVEPRDLSGDAARQ